MAADDTAHFVVARVSDAALLREIAMLRYQAWAATGEVPEFIARQSMDQDEHDVHGMHWAVLHKGRPVAAARMCIHNCIAESPDPEAYDGYHQYIQGPVASLTRLVVAPKYQGMGLTEQLRVERLRVAEARRCRSIICCAEEETVMAPLERHGFIRLGPTRIRYLAYAPSIVLLKRFGAEE